LKLGKKDCNDFAKVSKNLARYRSKNNLGTSK